MLNAPVNWPTVSANPVSEFTEEGFIARTLFRTGAADLRSPRNETVQPINYFQHIMRYKDRRFARDPWFLFHAMNSLMPWQASNTGSIYEWQHRDCAHVHFVVWLNAPDIADLDSKSEHELAELAQYFGNLVTTFIPPLKSATCSSSRMPHPTVRRSSRGPRRKLWRDDQLCTKAHKMHHGLLSEEEENRQTNGVQTWSKFL